MKVLHASICLLISFTGVLGFANEPAAEVDPLSGVTGLLAQEHQHPRPSAPPMSLAELETAALSNNLANSACPSSLCRRSKEKPKLSSSDRPFCL